MAIERRNLTSPVSFSLSLTHTHPFPTSKTKGRQFITPLSAQICSREFSQNLPNNPRAKTSFTNPQFLVFTKHKPQMNLPNQHRKRKRIQSPLCTLKSFLLCSSLLTLLYVLLYSTSTLSSSSGFHPVLIVPSLSLLSYSSSTTTATKPVQDFSDFSRPLKIENRVLFPDHVLLFVSGKKNELMKKLECVYYGRNGNFRVVLSVKNVVSVDEYDEFRSVVRCPLPSLNYTADVDLRWFGAEVIIGEDRNGVSNRTARICSWENLVYEAVVDGDTVVAFVKGLNLRANRKYDPSRFGCEFWEWESVRTEPLAVAQEVVRCPLPRSILNNLGKVKGSRVTVGVTRRNARFPSVAKISGLGRKRGEVKYKLCACTMVWNQGSAIREWIMYHSWLGVERWFIYDNNSDDGTDEVIQELDSLNYNVTRHVWPWIKTQEAGFSHCALRAKNECSWVSFMDVDEYFYFPYSYSDHKRFREFRNAGRNGLRTLVANISSTSRAVAEIRTSCYSFGPSGLSSPPKQGVTVSYMCRLQSPERHKSIVRTDALDATLLNVVHHFYLKKGFKSIDMPQSIVVINHYKYQVWEVFRTKFHRRVATYVTDWHESQNEGSRDRVPGLGTEAIQPPDWPRKFCEVWDTGLRDIVLANLADVATGMLPWETQSTGKLGSF